MRDKRCMERDARARPSLPHPCGEREREREERRGAPLLSSLSLARSLLSLCLSHSLSLSLSRSTLSLSLSLSLLFFSPPPLHACSTDVRVCAVRVYTHTQQTCKSGKQAPSIEAIGAIQALQAQYRGNTGTLQKQKAVRGMSEKETERERQREGE